MILVRRVEGDSMLPALRPGQIVIAHRIRKFHTGQIVIAFVDGREVIKRIKSINSNSVFLTGDNIDNSRDSRHFGPVSDVKIEGIVFWPKV